MMKNQKRVTFSYRHVLPTISAHFTDSTIGLKCNRITKQSSAMHVRTAAVFVLAATASAFSPVMMCDANPSNPNGAARRAVSAKPASSSGIPDVGRGRRGALGNLFKGIGAVVVGDALLAELAEAGAVRTAATFGAEEAVGAGAVVEGAAALRNGQVVMSEMEQLVFGKSFRL